MKWWIVCLPWLALCTPTIGQNFVWEKSFHLGGESYFSVQNASDGQILAGGQTSKFGVNIPGNAGFYRAVLVKYTGNGDTLWLKKLPILGSVKNLFLNENGLIWATCQVTNPNLDPLNNFYFPAVFLLANDSSIVVQKQFPEMHRFEVGDSYPTVDGGLIVFGQRSPSFYPGYEQDFYAFKVDALGQLQWSRPYNPGPTNSFCQGSHIEPMANGNFLVSGSMGSRIVSFEIDPETGNDTNFVQWYQTPGNFLLYESGVVQAKDSTYRISSYTSANTQKFFLGSYKNNTTKLWGGEQLGGCYPPVSNHDGSIILNHSSSQTSSKLSKINSDSSIAWSLNTNSIQLPGKKLIIDLLYLDDESGVLVGSYNQMFSGRSDDFYIAKFSGIGEPFDPTGVKQPHLVKTDAVPFPNPAQTSFRFKKAFQKGEVYLFTITGKRVFSEPRLLPDTAIDVSGLAAGTYLYRAVLDGRPHWGKIVKK